MINSNHVIHFESFIPMNNIWFIIFIRMFIFHLWWMSTFLFQSHSCEFIFIHVMSFISFGPNFWSLPCCGLWFVLSTFILVVRFHPWGQNELKVFYKCLKFFFQPTKDNPQAMEYMQPKEYKHCFSFLEWIFIKWWQKGLEIFGEKN
jgi:hypothetical protein